MIGSIGTSGKRRSAWRSGAVSCWSGVRVVVVDGAVVVVGKAEHRGRDGCRCDQE